MSATENVKFTDPGAKPLPGLGSVGHSALPGELGGLLANNKGNCVRFGFNCEGQISGVLLKPVAVIEAEHD